MKCRIIDIKSSEDSRGTLFVAEGGKEIPFELKRVFYVTGLVAGRSRGHHAHRVTHQMLFCLDGAIEVKTRGPGGEEETWRLDDPAAGLYLPPMIWTVFESVAPLSLCLVLASTLYDPDDYIRDIEDFDLLATL